MAVLLGVLLLAALGCTNTAHGVQKDYQKAEDQAERIGK